jgi:hypothetical protein
VAPGGDSELSARRVNDRARAFNPMILHLERAWVYTSGEVTGRLPFAGCVTVLTWNGAPGVARREAADRRLYGLQD